MSAEGKPPYLVPIVLLSDAEDCQRIAETHITKQPRQTRYIFHSIISTTDNAYWRKQRSHFNPVFLPGATLSKVRARC